MSALWLGTKVVTKFASIALQRLTTPSVAVNERDEDGEEIRPSANAAIIEVPAAVLRPNHLERPAV
jgi:hypothetical protein